MTMPRVMMMILVLALAACSKKETPVLTRIKSTSNGPDEFSILPGKPLQTPEDYSALPAPTPGGRNLTDVDPNADGIVALGGNPGALGASTIPASDGGLIRHAGRYGVTPGIRSQLATEDDAIRRRHGRVNIFRIGPLDDYTTAYKRQWLDPWAEIERLRRSGIRTPAAPPEPET